MNNICIFVNTLLKGGSEKQAVLLAKLLKSDYKISFVIYYSEKIESELLEQLLKDKIEIIKLKGTKIQKIWKYYKFLKHRSPHITFNYLLFPNFLGGIIGKIAGIKYTIGGIRSSVLEKNKIFLNKLSQNYVNRYTIYNNYKGLEFTNKYGFNNKKALVIPNCIIINKDSIEHKDKEIISILSVGRFDYSKDYFTALKTIKLLEQNKNHFNYTIIGWGEIANQIEKWIDELSLRNTVKMVINPPELTKYFIEADIFFQTSIFEGLSNTIMEAMNYSLPIITTDVGDNDKLVIHGKNGYLAKIKETTILANYAKELIQNHSLRTKFGEYGYNHLKKNYSNDIFKRKYIKFINSLN